MLYTKSFPLNVVIIDGGFHTRMDLYRDFFRDKRFDLTKLISVEQFFDQEKRLLKTPIDLFIINPTMPDYGHYGGPDNTEHGKLTGLFFYRDKLQWMDHAKGFVWAHSKQRVLDHWGENIVEKIVIKTGEQDNFSFLPYLQSHFPNRFPKRF